MTHAENVAQHAAGDPAIEIFHLTRWFGEFNAVDRVNLVVPHGGILGLLGPNGAGKNTLIKMLTTLMKPLDGTARVAGFDIVQAPSEIRKRIGCVPQRLSADGGSPASRVSPCPPGCMAFPRRTEAARRGSSGPSSP